MCNHDSVISKLNMQSVKKCFTYLNFPANENWRFGVLKNMHDIINSQTNTCSLTIEEYSEILEYTCVS